MIAKSRNICPAASASIRFRDFSSYFQQQFYQHCMRVIVRPTACGNAVGIPGILGADPQRALSCKTSGDSGEGTTSAS